MSSALLEHHQVEARTPGPCPVVATSRLVLRPHRLSDADSITEPLSDFSMARMLARVPQPYDRQDALDWLQIQVSGSVTGWSAAITMGDDVHIGTFHSICGLAPGALAIGSTATTGDAGS